MKNITKTVIEALTARGFSEPEAIQLISRVREGNDELPAVEQKVDANIAKQIYDRGFCDGRVFEQQEQYRMATESQQNLYNQCVNKQYSQTSNANGSFGAPFGGPYSGIFGNGF